ncbi:MAG TPA: inorganic phosphate transporter [Nitrososphaerales archaeon]
MNVIQYEFLLPVLVLVFSWNNSSLTTGSLAGSELLSYRRAVYLSIIGLVAGTVLEGNKMNNVTTKISPKGTQEMVLISVGITIVLVMYLSMWNIPVSITNALVGSFIGAILATGVSVDVSYFSLIVVSWTVSPVIAASLTILLYKFMTRVIRKMSLLAVDTINRIGVMVTVFVLAYSLGANNIGLINGLAIDSNLALLILNLIMLCLGVLLFGKRIAQSVGTKLVGLSPLSVLTAMLCTAGVLWFFTQLSIPIAVTQVAIGSLIGSSLTKRPVILNKKHLLEVFGSWILMTVFSLLLGYVLGTIFLQ